MVIIETDNGRFEGETIREAERAAKKAAREAAKLEAARAELRKRATLEAMANGFKILRAVASDNGIPRGWAVRPAEKCYGVKHLEADPADRLNDRYEIETEHGRGVLKLYRGKCRGFIDNASGWLMACVVDDYDGNPRVYAVGAHEGEADAELVPGVSPDQFRKGGAV